MTWRATMTALSAANRVAKQRFAIMVRRGRRHRSRKRVGGLIYGDRSTPTGAETDNFKSSGRGKKRSEKRKRMIAIVEEEYLRYALVDWGPTYIDTVLGLILKESCNLNGTWATTRRCIVVCADGRIETATSLSPALPVPIENTVSRTCWVFTIIGQAPQPPRLEGCMQSHESTIETAAAPARRNCSDRVARRHLRDHRAVTGQQHPRHDDIAPERPQASERAHSDMENVQSIANAP